jgi:hypothetical protein
MKLPYRKRAVIAPEKIDGYLLSTTHQEGKHKARVFKALGYDQSNRDVFENTLLKIAKNNDVVGVLDNVKNGINYGKKYYIDGIIGTQGRSRNFRTVWQILANKRTPSLVTVKPL